MMDEIEDEEEQKAGITQEGMAMAQRIVTLLNELLEKDRPAIAALIANRVPCNEAMADHPTLQVSAQHGGFFLGPLGLLNGICGIHVDGMGPIEAVFSDPEPGRFANLLKFRVRLGA